MAEARDLAAKMVQATSEFVERKMRERDEKIRALEERIAKLERSMFETRLAAVEQKCLAKPHVTPRRVA
jgi:hypothetical protein